MKNYKFETLQLRAGQEKDPVSKATSVPIYMSNAYEFDNVEYGSELFKLNQSGNIYTRLNNTTTEVFEKRMAALENGVAAVATASGQSAVFTTITCICQAGDNIVSIPYIYGGTFTLFSVTLKNFGIDVRFSSDDTKESIETLVDENTKIIYLENIGNPAFNIPDYEPIIEFANKKGICVIVDNTFGCGGYLFQPITWGANVVIHSCTKWINGHGSAMGGIVIDGGNMNWDPKKYPLLALPSESYHGLVYTEKFGAAALAGAVRVDGLRNFGTCISPFNSFLMIQGLETLSLRVERSCENTLAVAEFLASHPAVESVNYPGLKSNKYHELGKKYLRNGFGAVLTFRLKGGYDAAARLVEKLELILHVGSVGDAKSLIVHPASTTHSQLSEKEQIASCVYPNMLRLSVGIENIDDIIEDLNNALK